MGNISTMASRGTGLLALFCDLDPRWHAEFRQWLEEDMFPARLAIGFRACASYDLWPGDDAGAEPFATLYETPVSGDLYAQPYQALRESRDARDRAFHARFQNMSRYTLAWMGPELAGPMAALAPWIHVDRFAVPAHAMQDFNARFVDRYLPACAAFGGLVRVRRFLAIEGQPSHVMVHEFANEAALSQDGWARLRDDGMWAWAEARTSATYRRIVEARAITAAA